MSEYNNLTNTYSTTMVPEECCVCHIPFGMPKDFQNDISNNGGSFFCPVGHKQYYSKTEVQRLKDEVSRQIHLREQTESDRNLYKRRFKEEKQSKAAYKGLITKTKNRVAKGVCPCCNKYFERLHRHMKSKHPDYAEKDKK